MADLRLNHIGFVFQAYNLIPVLSAYENVEFIMQLQGVTANQRRQKAEAILNEVPLITTRTSGHAEFIWPYHPFLVDGMYEPYMAKSEFTQNMNWFEPSINSIRLNLRSAYNLWSKRGNPDPDWKHNDYLAKCAKDQLEYFNKRNYTVERVANDLKEMLKEITNE